MQQIESKTGHPAAEIDEALELVLQEIGSVLADGESISLRASHGHGKTACPMERTPTAMSPVSSLPPCFIAMPGLPL